MILDKFDTVVSIGMGCWTSDLLKAMNKRTTSLPFDWILSYPAIISKCIEHLMSTQDPKETFSMFFSSESFRTSFVKMEHYITTNDPSGALTTKDHMVLPHIKGNFQESFIRKLDRLLTLLNSNQSICFVYLSPFNKQSHFRVDDTILTRDIWQDMNTLCNVLNRVRDSSKHEIFHFDFTKEETVSMSELCRNYTFVQCDEVTDPNDRLHVAISYFTTSYVT